MNQEFDDFDRPDPQQPKEDPFDTFFTTRPCAPLFRPFLSPRPTPRMAGSAATRPPCTFCARSTPGTPWRPHSPPRQCSPTFGPPPPSTAPRRPACTPAPPPARSTPPSAVPIASASFSVNWTAGRATSCPSKHHPAIRRHETSAQHIAHPRQTAAAPEPTPSSRAARQTSHPQTQSSLRETMRQRCDATERPSPATSAPRSSH